MWDRLNVNLSSRNIIEADIEKANFETITYKKKDERKRLYYNGSIRKIKRKKIVPHGYGKLVYSNGIVQEGLFRNG